MPRYAKKVHFSSWRILAAWLIFEHDWWQYDSCQTWNYIPPLPSVPQAYLQKFGWIDQSSGQSSSLQSFSDKLADFQSFAGLTVTGQWANILCNNYCNMVRIFKRGESRETFCTVKCVSTGEGFHTKERACIFHGTVKQRTVKRRLTVWLYVSKKVESEYSWTSEPYYKKNAAWPFV